MEDYGNIQIDVKPPDFVFQCDLLCEIDACRIIVTCRSDNLPKEFLKRLSRLVTENAEGLEEQFHLKWYSHYNWARIRDGMARYAKCVFDNAIKDGSLVKRLDGTWVYRVI